MMEMRVFARGFILPGLCAWLLGSSCSSLPKRDTEPRPAAAAAVTSGQGAASEDIAEHRQRSRAKLFDWQEFSPQAFALARSQGRLVLLDCVAVWCHWCHVMDEATYADEEVGALLRDRFVTLRVDVDARPDLAARYEDWGWPATVIFSPSGEELGKFRGYIPPDELRAALLAATAEHAAAAQKSTAAPSAAGGLSQLAAPPDALSWVGNRVALDLDQRYDEESGGWGKRHKIPLGANLEFELLRARHGDTAALERARRTFAQQRALLDPVWGGLYQYSVSGVWTKPHFEKRLPIQTENLEALARAYALTQDPSYLQDALRIDGYLGAFLQDENGAFLVSQDADLGGYEGQGRFVEGHTYYTLDDVERRKLGVPRIDKNVYPYENGLGIAALIVLSQVVKEPARADALVQRARRAAELMLAQFVETDGTVIRSRASRDAARFLSDAAALGRGLALLAARTREPRYLAAARRVAEAMLRRFAIAANDLPKEESADARWLLWGHTTDPAAVGVFARRERPFSFNVLAARFLISLANAETGAGSGAASGTHAATLRLRARAILAALSAPQTLDNEGFMLGEYLLALDEAGALRWRK
jgi:uncharacterized protein YyaL (SSP411 family)